MNIVDINENIFRAYDVRGKYPEDINEDVAYTFGLGYGSFLRKNNIKECLVGCDNRPSSDSLYDALTKGILSTGVNIISLGFVTTPLVYFARNYLHTPASIMITASHNPGNDNGFKFSFDESGNVKGKGIKDFYNFISQKEFVSGSGILAKRDIKAEYAREMLKTIYLGSKKLKVVFDLGSGATTCIAKKVFNDLNIEAYYICDEADGTFPYHHPDPSVESNMAMLKEKVLELNADLGIGFDGDGDRLGIIDNKGNFVPADIFSSLYIVDILKNSTNHKILGDIKCTSALKDLSLKYNGEYTECRTGASFMMDYMVKDNHALGIEYSGHIYFNDRFLPITSGVYAALRMIEILSASTTSLSDLITKVPKYYKEPEIRLEVNENKKEMIVNKTREYAEMNNLKYSAIDGIKVLYPDSWALVRSSNTGPFITIIFEAKEENELKNLKNEYLSLINLYNK